MRAALGVAAALVAGGLLLVAIAASVPPLSRTCASDLDEPACAASVDAVLRRGLPTLHPLILAAHVRPGPAAGVGQLGHRATVAFELLGVPGRTEVALFYDSGSHWGGQADRGAEEIVAWALAPVGLAALAGATLVGLAARRRGGRARRPTG